jgi:hypothetical protein
LAKRREVKVLQRTEADRTYRIKDPCGAPSSTVCEEWKVFTVHLGWKRHINPLTPNDLQKRRAMVPLKIKIPSKKSQLAALRGEIYFRR